MLSTEKEFHHKSRLFQFISNLTILEMQGMGLTHPAC